MPLVKCSNPQCDIRIEVANKGENNTILCNQCFTQTKETTNITDEIKEIDIDNFTIKR